MTKTPQEAIERLQRMPEDRRDLLAKLMLHKIEEGERQIETGQTVSHDEAKRRLEKWLSPQTL
jgi:predicted transcriptional regulator